MLKNITIGQYLPGESFIHKLDPRTKIIISMLFIACLFIINKFIGYTLIVGFLLAVILIAKIPFRFIFNGLKPIFLLVVLTAVLNIFMLKGPEGTEVFSIGFLKAYPEGLSVAAFMAIRLILLIIGTSLLTLTTSPIELTDGIEKLLKPIGKEIAHELAMMMTIALRFIPTLIEETDKIMSAQKARGAEIDSGSLRARVKNLIPILIPLFVSSFRRAEELATAMECRCYNGGDGRTRLRQLKSGGRDFAALAVTCAFMGAIIAVNLML